MLFRTRTRSQSRSQARAQSRSQSRSLASAATSATLATTLMLSLLGCALEPDDATDHGAGASEGQIVQDLSTANVRVQAGTRLLLLEVTDDNYAIYQDGQTVYASALRAGAPRQRVAEVPAGNFAFVYRVGKVVFVWTNPDRTLPGFGVSPLVIWSSASGAHLASEASPIGTLATAASSDGTQVLFPTHGTPDGLTGALELASTGLSKRATVVANTPMNFPFGACRPLASFVAVAGHEDAVAAYCEGAATTATVSRWHHGRRRDLVTAAVTPPQLSIDPGGEQLFTLLAGSGNPVTVDLHDCREDGGVDVVASVAARFGFLGVDGDAFYSTSSATNPVLFRVGPRGPKQILELLGFLSFGFGSTSLSQPPTSPDGKWILSFDQTDPTTGLLNVRLSSTRSGAVSTLETTATSTVVGPPFTSSSARAIYAKVTDLSTFVADLVVADATHRQVYSNDVWAWDVGRQDVVTFTERAVFNPADPFFVPADLRSVNTAQPGQPRLIAAGAYTTYFPSRHRTAVAFTSDQEPGGPGLYVARVP
jgi:hypothetical protein